MMSSLREKFIFFTPTLFVVPAEEAKRVDGILRGGKIQFTAEENVQQ